MSDEEQRALEKALAADPSAANRWRYARALERAGRRRELFFELCELARGDDAEARERVAGWTPWTARTGAMGRRRALDLSRKVSVRSHTLTIPGESDLEVLAASDDTLFVSASLERGHFLGAIALDTFAPRWHTDDDDSTYGTIALVGDDLVHAIGQALVLRDGRTGDVLARLELDERVTNIFHAAGDRVVIEQLDPVERPTRLAGCFVGPGTLRGPVWARPSRDSEVAAATQDCLVLHEAGETEVWRVADGAALWSSAVLSEPEPGSRSRHGLVRAHGPEARGMLVWGGEPDLRAVDTAFAFDLETGALSGGRLAARVRQESLPPERFDADAERLVIGRHGSLEPDDADQEAGRDEVVLVRRSELSAKAPFPDVGRVLARPRDLRALALAQEAVYVANLVRGADLVVSGHARDGVQGLFEQTLPIPFDPSRAVLIPIEGALVLAATDDSRQLFLARLENAP